MYKIIGADQKEYGPVSADQLRQWLTEGRVNGQTKVQPADTTEWKTMAEIPEFATLLPKSPPPAPPLVRSAPITPLPPQTGNSSMAVWSMILGIFSVLCCQILGPVALILGAVSLSNLKKHPELTGRGFAITGIVLGIVSLLLVIVGIILAISIPDFLPGLQRSIQP